MCCSGVCWSCYKHWLVSLTDVSAVNKCLLCSLLLDWHSSIGEKQAHVHDFLLFVVCRYMFLTHSAPFPKLFLLESPFYLDPHLSYSNDQFVFSFDIAKCDINKWMLLLSIYWIVVYESMKYIQGVMETVPSLSDPAAVPLWPSRFLSSQFGNPCVFAL